jgi:RimJ/RimL family protein N-acetyltransferase
LYDHSPEVAAWVASRIPHVGAVGFGPCSALGVINEPWPAGDGRLVGGVVYHNYHPQFGNIELSFAGEGRWLTREIVCALLRYPFGQLDCQRVTGCVPRTATSARRFLDNFGFKREGVVRKGFGTDDLFVFGLLRTEWQRSKWIKPRQERQKLTEAMNVGKERSEAAAGA